MLVFFCYAYNFKSSAMSKFGSNKIIIPFFISLNFLFFQFGFRLPVLVTSIIMLLMNSGYIFLWNIPDNRRYYALIIRFFVGIAAGQIQFLLIYAGKSTNLSIAVEEGVRFFNSIG